MTPRYICLTLAAALFCSFASAQWKQIGPYVGGANCFATSGSRVFAGMYGGILVSTDNGTSWTAVSTGLTDSNVTALAVSGTSLLAGTSSGIFLSTDNGTHWTSAISGLYVYSFGVCGTKLFAAAADSGERIFISTDSGISWNAANMPFPRFSPMVQLGSILYAGVNDGVVGGLYLSPDNGDSWTLSSNGLAAPHVSALAASGTAVFAGTRNGIFRSTNSGASWTAVDSGLTSTNVRALAVSGNTLFAGTDSGIFLSTDNGDTWHKANSGLVSKSVYVLFVSGTRIFASTSLGISVSTDNGSNWAVRKPGRIPNVGITALAARGPELFVAAAWGGGGPKSSGSVENCVFHSTDNGESWAPQLEADGSAIIVRDADVFVGTGKGSWLAQGVLRSTDHGTTWTPGNEGFPKATAYGDTSGYAHVTCFASNGQALFAGTHGSGVYSTTNDSMSWKVASSGLTNFFVRDLVFSGPYFLVATDSGVFRSMNNGTSWSASNEGFPPPAPPGYSAAWGVNSFVTMGTSLFAGGWHSWERGIVFRSTDHGTHWTAAETDFARQVSGMGVSGTNLFAGTRCCDSLYLSTDGGARWRSVGPKLGNSGGPLATNDTYVFAGTGGHGMWGPYGSGLFRLPLSEMVTPVDRVTRDLLDAFMLDQNYPNPFNPSTTIKYELPKSSVVKLSVFDMLGRQVSVLVDERNETGVHEVKFDGSNLASGVYFYRLHAGDFVQSKKLVILK